MPNLTFFISKEKIDNFVNYEVFTNKCFSLCIDVLAAKPKNVHIIYTEVKSGVGYPVYAELRYRLNEFRTSNVMEKFMCELDAAIQNSSGLKARIRCFGYTALQLYARN